MNLTSLPPLPICGDIHPSTKPPRVIAYMLVVPTILRRIVMGMKDDASSKSRPNSLR